MSSAILRDWDAFDEFHHEIWTSTIGRAGIEHFGNVRVIHHRERLTLSFKPRNDLAGVHARLDNLEGYGAADGVDLLGHENHAHAAFADLL